MGPTLIVKGRLVGPTTIELAEPISPHATDVDLLVRISVHASAGDGETVVQFLRRLAPGTRSKQEIDEELRKERDSWEER